MNGRMVDVKSRTCNVYVGSETGLLKGVNTEKKEYYNLHSLTEANKENEITSLCWSNSLENTIYVGQKNQVVKLFDCNDNLFTQHFNLSSGSGALRGVVAFNDCIVTAVESGLIQVWNENEEPRIKIDAGENLFKMRQNPSRSERIATGGEENDLKIWDLQSGQFIFKAKNVRNDFLDLRVPVWVTDMQFVPDSEKIITCSRHHQVRLYDPSASQRRPVISMEFEKYPLMSLSLAHRENQVIVGSSRGRMALLDLRKKSLVHVFKGFAGSIRHVQCHPTLPLIASCGLDRFLRIHELNTHKLLKKIYLKSRLNCLMLKTDFSAVMQDQAESLKALEAEKKATVVQNEDDELWRNMKTVKEIVLKKKRLLSDQTTRLTGMRKKKPKLKSLENE